MPFQQLPLIGNEYKLVQNVEFLHLIPLQIDIYAHIHPLQEIIKKHNILYRIYSTYPPLFYCYLRCNLTLQMFYLKKFQLLFSFRVSHMYQNSLIFLILLNHYHL